MTCHGVVLFLFLLLAVMQTSRDYKSSRDHPDYPDYPDHPDHPDYPDISWLQVIQVEVEVRNVARSYNALLAHFYFQFQVICNLHPEHYQTKREEFKYSSVLRLTQINCKYVQVTSSLTPFANFKKLTVSRTWI